ncbi:hypothetical protein ECO55CA74_08445 [Escherichia coli O55:H7 str. RM12579]|nr:hypothetical protein ECO55CA74_08445 [Escherichia coli O55:H7 str. RM12579]
MHTGFLPRLWFAGLSLMLASPVRGWKKQDINASDNYSHFVGSSWRGGPEHGAGGAEKGAFFDFYGTITTSSSY